MYLHENRDLGESRSNWQSCNPVVQGLGQSPWDQIPREFHDRIREAIKNHPVMQAIRRLPEGQVCPAPEHLAAHEQRIREKLRAFAPDKVEEGIGLWRLSMGFPLQSAPAWQQRPVNQGPTMRSITPGEVTQTVLHTARVLEERFQAAEYAGDAEGMAKAAEQYYQLLNRYPEQKPGEIPPGRGHMEKQREQIARIRDDILRRAPNLAAVVRHLGPLELANMRDRIRAHTLQRVSVRQQRTRARR